ncbi:hypothetical protein DT076_07460 [Desertihabitans brevis]|uniref:Uncharacterized protein n=1 Tax=Desertihabitans brevis TaxID=2268447 RepID=A0A367YVG8_9ACTN|nr:hypothetical protein [Desertihabitans brevis]RCK69864.1 hypothetical protein DT076_07460 [Desertihabitans brevis]
MRLGTSVVVGALGVGAGALVRRLWARGSAQAETSRERWLVVTVLLPEDEVAPAGRLPEPLAELGDRIEVEVRPAPGDKGTEIAARYRDPKEEHAGLASRVEGESPRQQLRSALRRSKQLLEVGEVLRVSPAPHGERSATPGGALLEKVTEVGRKEGRL